MTAKPNSALAKRADVSVVSNSSSRKANITKKAGMLSKLPCNEVIIHVAGRRRNMQAIFMNRCSSKGSFGSGESALIIYFARMKAVRSSKM